MSAYRLCHLSDPHVSPARPGSEAVFDFLVGDAAARGCDHLLITGDVVDAPGDGALDTVVAILAAHGLWRPGRCTLLPGNHDVSGRPGDGADPPSRRRALRAFLDAAAEVNRPVRGPGAGLDAGRPLFKRLGPVELLAVVSASDHHDIEGRVGEADLAALSAAFGRAARGLRVVGVHHHPVPLPVGRSEALGRFVPEGLLGGAALLDRCAALGVSLVLHGHIHTSGGAFDLAWKGVRVRCQGTAKGERTAEGRRRYGYDVYTVAGGRVNRRRRFYRSDEIVDGLLQREADGEA